MRETGEEATAGAAPLSMLTKVNVFLKFPFELSRKVTWKSSKPPNGYKQTQSYVYLTQPRLKDSSQGKYWQLRRTWHYCGTPFPSQYRFRLLSATSGLPLAYACPGILKWAISVLLTSLVPYWKGGNRDTGTISCTNVPLWDMWWSQLHIKS